MDQKEFIVQLFDGDILLDEWTTQTLTEARSEAEEAVETELNAAWLPRTKVSAKIFENSTVLLEELMLLEVDMEDEPVPFALDESDLVCMDEQRCCLNCVKAVEWEILSADADELISYLHGDKTLGELSFSTPASEAEGRKVKRQKLSRSRVRENAARWFNRE